VIRTYRFHAVELRPSIRYMLSVLISTASGITCN
jgi:hypothetical protein